MSLRFEGDRSPVQAANDEPPAPVDLAIARLETLRLRKRAIAYLRALDNRLDALDRGEVPPMPEWDIPVPAYLRGRP